MGVPVPANTAKPSPIPYVPITTAMFGGDMSALGNLTTTWILFFQQVAATPAGQTLYDKATFGLAIGGSLVTGSDLCPRYIVRFTGTIVDCAAMTKTPSTGSDVHVDIVVNQAASGKTPASSASIFGTNGPLVVPAGSLALTTTQTFAAAAVAADNWITVNVLQVGNRAPGGDLVIVLTIQVS